MSFGGWESNLQHAVVHLLPSDKALASSTEAA
jgi:hypothetical protein